MPNSPDNITLLEKETTLNVKNKTNNNKKHVCAKLGTK